MDKAMLSQVYYINKEIKSIQLELNHLKEQNFYKKNNISDMPRGGQAKDFTVEYVNQVMILEDLLNHNLKRLQEERYKLEQLFEQVEDPELRLILRLRSVNNMRWEDIGWELNMDRRTASRKYMNFMKDALLVT